MKLIIILSYFIISPNLFSQTFVYNYTVNWSEQFSGVNSKLNHISTYPNAGNFSPAVIAGDNGVVLITFNKGTNWTNVGSNGIPNNIDLISIAFLNNSSTITAGNIDNTTYIYRTSNNGQNWNQVFSQEHGKINTICHSQYYHTDNFLYVIGNPVGGRWSIWKSTDFGLTWDSTGLYIPQENNEQGFVNSSKVYKDWNGLYKIWFGTNNKKIYYTGNSGVTWQSLAIDEQNIYSIENLGKYVVAGGENLYASQDSGFSWIPEQSLGQGNINSIKIPGIIIAIPIFDNNMFNGPIFYIRNSNKIYYTDNGGGNDWEEKYFAPIGSYMNLGYSLMGIWAIRDNGGITYGKIDVVTSFDPSSFPYSFELEQNYPNPFNPKTKIPVHLYKSTNLSIKVFDIMGKYVATIFDGNIEIFPFPRYDIYNYVPRLFEWDGSNYPSGVYYYQVVADDYKETRKMMLIK